MLFYTNETTRRLFREHLEKIATRRNTVTGKLYRDDATIFGYELMNEAQSVSLRWAERRAWIVEMSAYLKSLDADHLIASGEWGYRTAAERREWLADHSLPHIDYCDVHNYPRDDHNSFVESPNNLGEFIRDRVAAAYSIRKPLVFGEFGMGVEGYNGFSQIDWYHAFLDHNARFGSAGAIFWIITPDPRRGYGVTYTTSRDQQLLAEIRQGSDLFASLASQWPPRELRDSGRHLVPRQFAFNRALDDPGVKPQLIVRDDRSCFIASPRWRWPSDLKRSGRTGLHLGLRSRLSGICCSGRPERRKVGSLLVRAHIQPVLPIDARPADIKTRVNLFVNGTDCGSRFIPFEPNGQPIIQEWNIDSWLIRLRAARGLPFTVRFVVNVDADWPYGVNISNWPEGYDSHNAQPLEVEVR